MKEDTKTYKKFMFTTDYTSNTMVRGVQTFKKGDVVEGTENVGQANARIIPSITTKEGYFIPLSVLKPVPTVSVPEEKDALSKSSKIVKTNAFKQGAVVGAVIGAGYGFFGNKNVFYATMIGMFTGGAIGYLVNNRNKTTKKA